MEDFLEKIKSKSELEKIFSLGNAIFSQDKKIKANYIFTFRSSQPKLRYAITVSSKNGNSVWRNRFKRIVRESIRAEIDSIKEMIFGGNLNLSIIFSPGRLRQSSQKKLFLRDLKPGVSEIIMSLKNSSNSEK